MAQQDLPILHTKLRPPRLPLDVLLRPRIADLLARTAAYPVTLVQAGPGFGKSTTLTALIKDNEPTAWLTLEQEDAIPQRFLSYLVHSFGRLSAGLAERASVLLEQQPEPSLAAVLDTLTNGIADHPETVRLILDDAQYLNESAEALALLNRFIQHAPPNLNILLATRTPLSLKAVDEHHLRGQVLTLDQQMLAFTKSEVKSLFADVYRRPLTDSQAKMLVARTEGWPIVLPLIRQQLQQGETIDSALEVLSAAESNLFQFMTQRLLDQLSVDIRHFLRTTSVLRYLDPAVCDFVRGAGDSAQVLRQLREGGLFVTALDSARLRYHHLFRDLLQNQLAETEKVVAHQRAGRYFALQQDIESALEHFVPIQASAEAAELLDQHGQRLISNGRLSRVAHWIASLPPSKLTEHPNLLLQLGDIARLQTKFDTALGWYQQAEAIYRAADSRHGIGRALRGQARVYLDTVRPAQAEELLTAALEMADRQADRASRARLLDLLAENLLNQGDVAQAQQYQEQARQLRDEGPSTAELPVRLMLRTGRLNEARQILEARAETERAEPILQPRSHRETLLLLALIASFQGDRETASRCGLEGTERGMQFNSPWITSVGYSRQGESWLLEKAPAGYASAQRCFEEAIGLSHELELPRLEVEAMWGLTQVFGFQGRLREAEQASDQAITIARDAGDEWIAAWIELTLGASYVLSDDAENARRMLAMAAHHLAECGDQHGVAVARLWQCLLWVNQNDTMRLERDLGDLLARVEHHGYEFLFLRPTLVGPPDPRGLIPLLIFARDRDIQRGVAERLLTQLGLADIELHPGYQLRIETLGSFRVARGRRHEVKWSRQSARDLFQLLITERHRWLHREEIMGLLWPDASVEEATRHFKTAYAALCKELEPQRKRNAPSAYIMRDGSRYRLRNSADLWIDAVEFDTLVADGDRGAKAPIPLYQRALSIYKGEYLADAPYLEWAIQERRRLHNRYLRTAERLAQRQQAADDWSGVIETAYAMLRMDGCWEPAYRYLMIAHVRLGNPAEARRTFDRCIETLSAELDLAPSAATLQLKHTLLESA